MPKIIHGQKVRLPEKGERVEKARKVAEAKQANERVSKLVRHKKIR